MFRRWVLLGASLFLVVPGCSQDGGSDEQFSLTGIVVEVRIGEVPEGVEITSGGNADASGAIIIQTDGNAEASGFGECNTRTFASQRVYFTEGTTFLPQTVPNEAGFPTNLTRKRVGADGPLNRDGEDCKAVADRFRVREEEGATATSTPGATASATTTPDVTGSPAATETATATATAEP